MTQRPIKFRAWIDSERRFSYHDLSIQEDIGGLEFIVGEAWPHTLDQFTGLLDKNGKEIYEGDVVSVSEHETESDRKTYHVAWMGPEYPAFDLDGWDGESNALAEIGQSGEWDIEVIGNIHENPDLIESGEKQQEA